MIAMQYKVVLPRDYDMGQIRERVENNGYKTDGFPGLKFKAYLITEVEKGNLYNSYAPLYVWETSEGMNHFIFNGFYDNILNSFGWQQIHMGVPFSMNLGKDFDKSSFLVEYKGTIPEANSLVNPSFNHVTDYIRESESTGELLVYNPDKWQYSHFSFYNSKPVFDLMDPITLYEILHVSQ